MLMYNDSSLPFLSFAQGSEELSKKAKAVLRTVTQNSRSPMQYDAGAYYFLFVARFLMRA
jgi:hypothetical protein